MSEYHYFTLPSGIPVCVAEQPWMEGVSTGLWAGVGGRHDPAGLAGLAHFAEHMLFQGTRRRSARRLNLDIESAGGSMDAYTSEDHTAFFVRGPAAHFARYMDVLLDLYRNSVFHGDAVAKERDVISEEISMYREQPSQHVEDLLVKTVWPRHPLGNPIAGTEKSLSRIRAADLRKHAGNYFGKGNTVISAAGRITAEEVRRQLERLLPDGLSAARRPAHRVFRASPRRVPAIMSEAREIDQIQLALAFRTPGRGDAIQPALRLLNVLLGENTTSRLWTELREKRGLCYDAGSDITALQETGLLHLFAGVDPDRMETVLKVIFQELRRMVEKPPGSRTLQAAKDFTLAAGRLSMESTSHRMTVMAESMLLYGRGFQMEEVERRVLAVTAEQVRRAAAEIFRPGRLTAAFVGPAVKHDLIVERAGILNG